MAQIPAKAADDTDDLDARAAGDTDDVDARAADDTDDAERIIDKEAGSRKPKAESEPRTAKRK
jgi:hypothetical protein